VNDPLPLPEGFAVGHWTEREAGTGCTVIIAPAGTRGAVEVRGGGTGTRELGVARPRPSTFPTVAPAPAPIRSRRGTPPPAASQAA
jgi:L-aminopeptidase/D-esterase-like protein